MQLHTTSTDAVRFVVNNTDRTKMGISQAIGRERSFVGAILSHNRIPKLDTFVRIADAAGYDVVLRKRATDTEVLVDPE